MFRTDGTPERLTSFFDCNDGLIKDFKVADTFIKNSWASFDRQKQIIDSSELLANSSDKISHRRLNEIARHLH